MKSEKSKIKLLKYLYCATMPVILWIIWVASTNCITKSEASCIPMPKTETAASCLLPAPDGFMAQSSGNGTLSLNWQPVSEATGYQLSVYNSITQEMIYNNTLDGCGVTLQHLPKGVNYQCTLACRCSSNEISRFIIITEVML